MTFRAVKGTGTRFIGQVPGTNRYLVVAPLLEEPYRSNFTEQVPYGTNRYRTLLCPAFRGTVP